jgi:hypothetical protein
MILKGTPGPHLITRTWLDIGVPVYWCGNDFEIGAK